MQNLRVSLPSVGAREVGHGNTHPTTRTARFFSYTNYGKLNWPRKTDRKGGCDRFGRPLVVLATALIGQNSQSVIFFGFIQMRDTLSTNREHLRVAEVKSFLAIPKSMRSRVDKNKSMQRLISSLWGPGTAKFQVTWLLRIVQKGVSMWQCCAVDRWLMSAAYRCTT